MLQLIDKDFLAINGGALSIIATALVKPKQYVFMYHNEDNIEDINLYTFVPTKQ